MNGRCTYAYPGTYGHECGRPAVFAGVKASEYTANGLYFAHRCAECRDATGRDNCGIRTWEPLDQTKHRNVWRAQS